MRGYEVEIICWKSGTAARTANRSNREWVIVTEEESNKPAEDLQIEEVKDTQRTWILTSSK
jgi:hypothetical protein